MKWWSALVAPAMLVGTVQAQEMAGNPPQKEYDPGWAPFVIDHFARRDSAADARFLLDAPAGKHGFVRAREGHLYFDDGTRLKCWGVNLTGWTPGSEEIPAHEEADIFAAELARLGVNCVRLHFLDMPDRTHLIEKERGPTGDLEPVVQMPRGLIESDRPDTGHFDAEQLDRLDYFFSRLKAKGIYVNINLLVGHTWKPGDDVPQADLLWVAKGYAYFVPELIARQKEYARKLLDHRNAYTGLRYADDPAVSTVEIVNENSLLEFWIRNWLRGEREAGKPRHQLDITPRYHALLTANYNDWLAAHRTPAEIDAMRQEAGVASGAPVPLMRRQQFGAASKLRFHSEAQFLTDVERGFFADMHDFLREALGVKAPIVDTADHSYFIPGQPLLRSTQHADVIDAHVYWQHPAIFGKRNTPMVNDPEGSILQRLSRTAMAGKPFAVSEANEPFPHEYDAEFIPILASYAAFQDWDEIFFYTFETKKKDGWKGLVGDHFDMTQHPTKIAQLPVGAMIFLRGDVAAAKRTVTRSYSTDQVIEQMRMPMSAMPAFTPGYPPLLPLVHETRIACLDCEAKAAATPGRTMPIVSDTGELRWSVDDGRDGVVTVDTQRTQALVGHVRQTGARTTNLTADIATPFAAITLSSLDGKPIDHSDRLLLTTTARVKNSGMTWNARRSVSREWGSAPSMIEPVAGWLQFRDLVGVVDITATPLDGASQPMAPIKARLLENGWELPIGEQATTSYLIRVYR
ncbi:hypothetical protein [Stakelama saccharophila]|uniref:Glycoside hydrolase family 42 N-terminal domain-containing protein n=1 Tax=Stakelama saccharophila TaxID=3075605 RepID=A0ABZ0B9M2_9SPHN|nr:hypothetical protein [Stakelama sp. W311]WNO54089.1 hypothetical protein RPR59_02180 [Stakelama sp. W311]